MLVSFLLEIRRKYQPVVHYILIAAIESLGLEPNNYIINHASLREIQQWTLSSLVIGKQLKESFVLTENELFKM